MLERIVSVSEVLELIELIVDIVISDALSEPEYEDVAMPTSCLWGPQCISGIDV